MLKNEVEISNLTIEKIPESLSNIKIPNVVNELPEQIAGKFANT